MNFEKKLEENLEKIKEGKYTRRETQPFKDKLIKLNENRIFTFVSQPSMVSEYVIIDNKKCIEMYRSFLCFFIEINDKNNKFLENLKKRENTYIRITKNEELIYGNFPVYNCRTTCWHEENLITEGSLDGYALVTYLDCITLDRIADRIVVSNDGEIYTTDYENCYSVVITSTGYVDAIDIVYEEYKKIPEKITITKENYEIMKRLCMMK
jgi:hypothetical protein